MNTALLFCLSFFKLIVLFYGFSAGVAALINSVHVLEAFAHFYTVSPCFYNTSGLSVYVFMQVFLTLLGSALSVSGLVGLSNSHFDELALFRRGGRLGAVGFVR